MNDKKMSLKSYHNGDKWTAYRKNPKTGRKLVKEVDEKGNEIYEIVTQGTNRCKEMYKCLLREDLIVTTTFTKITKRIGKKDDTGEIELAYLHTEDTVKILE